MLDHLHNALCRLNTQYLIIILFNNLFWNSMKNIYIIDGFSNYYLGFNVFHECLQEMNESVCFLKFYWKIIGYCNWWLFRDLSTKEAA